MYTPIFREKNSPGSPQLYSYLYYKGQVYKIDLDAKHVEKCGKPRKFLSSECVEIHTLNPYYAESANLFAKYLDTLDLAIPNELISSDPDTIYEHLNFAELHFFSGSDGGAYDIYYMVVGEEIFKWVDGKFEETTFKEALLNDICIKISTYKHEYIFKDFNEQIYCNSFRPFK